MKMKSYYAETVEIAVSRARAELGAEAMLLVSRRSSAEAAHLGQYEVVFAAESDPGDEFRRQLNTVVDSCSTPDRLAAEVADLRQQLERTAAAFHRASALNTMTVSHGAGAFQAFSQLVGGGVDAETAHNLVATARQALGADSSERALVEAIRTEIVKAVATDSTVSRPDRKPGILALVGPPGAGKTCTLVKLAVRYGVAARKRIHFITLDTHRVGGADQLRTFAAIIGVSLEVINSGSALSHAIEASRSRDLVLIDTPGFDDSRHDLRSELAGWMRSQSAIDTHLVLPASARAETLRNFIATHDIFRPAKLLFTRVDEVTSLGGLFSLCLESRKPISFLSVGQSIPEDLREASEEEIADSILGASAPERASAAA